MLEMLFMLLSILKNIGYYTIVFSYKTGQLIVFGLQRSYDFVSVVFGTLWYASVIVSEDFHVFLSDVSARLGSVVLAVVQSGDQLARGVCDCLAALHSGLLSTSQLLSSLQQTVVHVCTKALTCATSVLAAFKHFCVLLGYGVWFAVTFIPLSIVYAFITVTYCAGRFFEEITNVVHTTFANAGTALDNFFQFMIDVPAESSAGLLIVLCLGYVLVKFQVLVFKTLHRIVLSVRESVRNKLRQYRVTAGSAGDVDLSSNKNGTCVICFERNKCLLTMPCRHLCMCVECWDQLQNYQAGAEARNCPVCRTDVQYTIHVY